VLAIEKRGRRSLLRVVRDQRRGVRDQRRDLRVAPARRSHAGCAVVVAQLELAAVDVDRHDPRRFGSRGRELPRAKLLDVFVPLAPTLLAHALGQSLHVLGADRDPAQLREELTRLLERRRVAARELDLLHDQRAVALRPQL